LLTLTGVLDTPAHLRVRVLLEGAFDKKQADKKKRSETTTNHRRIDLPEAQAKLKSSP